MVDIKYPSNAKAWNNLLNASNTFHDKILCGDRTRLVKGEKIELRGLLESFTATPREDAKPRRQT